MDVAGLGLPHLKAGQRPAHMLPSYHSVSHSGPDLVQRHFNPLYKSVNIWLILATQNFSHANQTPNYTHHLIFAAIPIGATAAGFDESSDDPISSTFTFGYSTADIEGAIDLTTKTFDIESDISLGENVNVDVSFGFSKTDIDVGGFELGAELISLGIDPSYHFGNGGYIGAYYRSGDLDVAITGLPINFGIDTHSVGLFGGYESGPLWAEAFFGKSDSDPSLGDVDIRDVGASFSYDVSPDMEVFGHIANTHLEGGGDDLDLTLLGLGAEYRTGNGLAFYGSLGRLNTGGSLVAGGDLYANQATIGATYAMQTSIPAVVSLEFTKTELALDGLLGIDTADIDSVSVGLTIPVGSNAKGKPLNSSTQTARGASRSAISGALATLR
ncbi:MAG: porin [Rhodobacteraceae bacterium]|nr:porin [Paracoccaceae bacterium]